MSDIVYAAPIAELRPGPDNDKWGTWWSLSSAVVVRMIGLLGYEVVNRTDAVELVAGGGRRDVPAKRAEVPTDTLVAQRRAGS